MIKKILFITGTRADYGKMKSLMFEVEKSENFECYVFITGMHTLKVYGDTRIEVQEAGFKNTQVFMNQIPEEPMDLILANTINGLSRYVKELSPDLIIVHGDRVETLAAAIVGALNNIRVGHVEGGEVSGTIDESIRHSVSKLSHIHFVSNESAKERLIQLGENQSNIFVIGSPDLDLFSENATLSFHEIKQRYDLQFTKYAIAMFHPVTSELSYLKKQMHEFCRALDESGDNYILIYPNNDPGSKIILEVYDAFKNHSKVRMFPSIRFEFFIELMRNAEYVIGNSSAGIHEAPYLGIPSINIGSRQHNRFDYPSIVNSDYDKTSIINAIKLAKSMKSIQKSQHFGEGKSSQKFIQVLNMEATWRISTQKIFQDTVKLQETEV